MKQIDLNAKSIAKYRCYINKKVKMKTRNDKNL